MNQKITFLLVGILLLGVVALTGCTGGEGSGRKLQDEVVIDGTLKYTVNEVKTVEEFNVTIGSPRKPKEGYKLLKVELTAENVGKERWQKGIIGGGMVSGKIETEDGIRYSPIYGYVSASIGTPGYVMPEESKEVTVYFEILENKTPQSINLYQEGGGKLVGKLRVPE